MTPPRRRAQQPATALGLAALLAGGGCGDAAEPLEFGSLFQLERTLEVVPIEIFRRPPASILRLPDGRFVLPETDGVWIHVVDADGQGLTRIGGPASGAPGASPEPPGRFHSLADVAPLPGGGLVAADRGSNVLTLFDAHLDPEETRVLPETRGVWQLEALPDGGVAAAVSPRHPVGGGQLLVVHPDGEVTSHLAPDPIFRHNRWQPLSATRIEALADGRILAYWPAFPWARGIRADSDTLGRVGGPSKRFRGPVTGPREGASLEALRSWYASFTPLFAVESAGPYIVFQFLALPDSTSGRIATRTRAAADDGEGRPTYANLYALDGTRVAADLPLPDGSRVLKTNDRERLYLLREASPRGLTVEVWRPDEHRARELTRSSPTR